MTLSFEVKNIPESAAVNVSSREQDKDNEHGHIRDLTGGVKDGWVGIPWKAVYTEDNDDSASAKKYDDIFAAPMPSQRGIRSY
ncbi:MAG: hypothetical protein LBD37_03310 [Treponema sp.]|jgi:hypothetical protein|nr:hypothetical protein [Treponema sp.]